MAEIKVVVAPDGKIYDVLGIVNYSGDPVNLTLVNELGVLIWDNVENTLKVQTGSP